MKRTNQEVDEILNIKESKEYIRDVFAGKINHIEQLVIRKGFERTANTINKHCTGCIVAKTDLRGSGSKENVGRHKNPYVSKRIDKMVPESVYAKCLSLIDAEVLKFKLELSKTKNSKK